MVSDAFTESLGQRIQQTQDVDSTLAHPLRRWPDIKSISCHCHVFTEIAITFVIICSAEATVTYKSVYFIICFVLLHLFMYFSLCQLNYPLFRLYCIMYFYIVYITLRCIHV